VEDLIDCSIYLEAFEENCFEDFDLQIFSTLPDLDFLDLDVMTDLCSDPCSDIHTTKFCGQMHPSGVGVHTWALIRWQVSGRRN
jgi:hypothetical protein